MFKIVECRRFRIEVVGGLSPTERFLATGCVTKRLRDGTDVATVDFSRIPFLSPFETYHKDIFLVRLGKYLMTWQVLGSLWKQGVWPICYEEIAAFSQQHPKHQLENPIVTIYETTDGGGTYGYASLGLSGGLKQRSFTYISSGDRWGQNCWFAVSSL